MLSGKSCLVTGASSGLGRRFAHVLAGQGAHVMAAARRTDRLADLVRAIEDAGGQATAFAFDALHAEGPEALMADIGKAIGTPDILINNAGISLPAAAQAATPDQFDRTMTVNVRTPWRLSQLCADQWIAARSGGCIVNIASILSRRVSRGVSLYSLSKAAILHMTAGHALEWARFDIRVNALCPGYIRTALNDAFWETEPGKAKLASLPRRRLGRPEDLDTGLLFLVDPRSRFVNGEAVTIDDAQSWAI